MIINARIYTMEQEGESYSAMGIKGGKIAALYKEQPMTPHKLSKAVIDADGKAVLPGFTDCHMHFMATVSTIRIRCTHHDFPHAKRKAQPVVRKQLNCKAMQQLKGSFVISYCNGYLIHG